MLVILQALQGFRKRLKIERKQGLYIFSWIKCKKSAKLKLQQLNENTKLKKGIMEY